jgi:hypothetical protein
MNTVEDRLREALAERAAQTSVDPDAWDKTMARSRHRLLPWRWPAWAVKLSPVVGVAAALAVIVAATLLGGHIGRGAGTSGSANASPSTRPSSSPSPSTSRPAGLSAAVREIPPVTPFVSISLAADGHQLRDSLWFGYVPGHAIAGIALCQFNVGGFYDGYSACTSGGLATGTLARSAATDGTGWIRLGVAASRATSVTALLPGGKSAHGTVRSVHGLSYKVWAVSYPVADAATLVFRDAAGHQVTRLNMPLDPSTPSRPSQGGIPLFRQSNGIVTAYRISGDRIGFWANDGSTWSDVPVSQSALTVANLPASGSRLSPLFGYAPSGTARVVVQLGDGRQLASRTFAAWPGSGLVFWGPVTLPAHTTLGNDTIVITYDSAGHVLREVPYIFIG